jgi:hypothetical protein
VRRVRNWDLSASRGGRIVGTEFALFARALQETLNSGRRYTRLNRGLQGPAQGGIRGLHHELQEAVLQGGVSAHLGCGHVELGDWAPYAGGLPRDRGFLIMGDRRSGLALNAWAGPFGRGGCLLVGRCGLLDTDGGTHCGVCDRCLLNKFLVH